MRWSLWPWLVDCAFMESGRSLWPTSCWKKKPLSSPTRMTRANNAQPERACKWTNTTTRRSSRILTKRSSLHAEPGSASQPSEEGSKLSSAGPDVIIPIPIFSASTCCCLSQIGRRQGLLALCGYELPMGRVSVKLPNVEPWGFERLQLPRSVHLTSTLLHCIITFRLCDI